MRKFLGGMAVATILKIIIYVVSNGIKLIANIMVFFGLYVPFFYLIYGEILLLFAGFTIIPYNSNVGLYVFGLVLACFCSVIITVRNLIIKPIRAVFGRDDKDYMEKHKHKYRRPPIRYSGGEYPRPRPYRMPVRSPQYGYLRIDSPREYSDRFDTSFERADVYRSEVNPEVIVYEYGNRFDLYRHNGNYLEYIQTKYK